MHALSGHQLTKGELDLLKAFNGDSPAESAYSTNLMKFLVDQYAQLTIGGDSRSLKYLVWKGEERDT